MTDTLASVRRAGGWTLTIGALLVVVTCACYLAAPPDAIAPTLDIPVDARAAAIRGEGFMRMAGTSGILGNPVMAVGALLVGIEAAMRTRPLAAVGWCLIVLSLIVFEIVDGLVGFALSIAAVQSGATFLTVRTLFSAYFLAGTTLFGVGAIFATAQAWAISGWRGWASRIALADGIAATIAGGAGLAGLSTPSVVGATIGVGALAFAVIGTGIATRRDAAA